MTHGLEDRVHEADWDIPQQAQSQSCYRSLAPERGDNILTTFDQNTPPVVPVILSVEVEVKCLQTGE